MMSVSDAPGGAESPSEWLVRSGGALLGVR